MNILYSLYVYFCCFMNFFPLGIEFHKDRENTYNCFSCARMVLHPTRQMKTFFKKVNVAIDHLKSFWNTLLYNFKDIVIFRVTLM